MPIHQLQIEVVVASSIALISSNGSRQEKTPDPFSPGLGYDQCTVRFLHQAGVDADFIKLEDRGIRGNGHMMILEKNHHESAKVMIDWLEKRVK